MNSISHSPKLISFHTVATGIKQIILHSSSKKFTFGSPNFYPRFVIALLKKEINSFLGSIIGYVVMIVFLLSIGLFMWMIPGTDFNILENGYANMDTLFIIAPWVFMFLIPAVTMRSFAEEMKSGTIELLFTRPLSDLQIIFSKYVAGVILVLFSMIPTLVYFISVYFLASPRGNIDVGGISGSYFGLLFLCSAFVSIGVFASSLSNNQIISFILAVIISFFFYTGFDSLSSLSGSGILPNILSQIGISSHYTSMSRGVMDTRDMIYFITLSAFFILLTKFIIEKRKW
jgi:ABC-2 type transport system permease protein